MDWSTYSDENLREMAEKGLPIPRSLWARARKLGIPVSRVSAKATALATARQATLSNYTPQEAAKKLGSPWTAKRIRKHLRRNRIPGSKVSGQWYVDREWVDAHYELMHEEPDE